MAIYQPSQFECDNMKPGDLVFVSKRNFLYTWYRKHSKKEYIKINVRTDWTEPASYKTYYQEDCTLLYNYELACIKHYNGEVPYLLSLDKNTKGFKTGYLKELNVGLYNIQLIFNNDFTITVPTHFFEQAIKDNDATLKNIQDSRKIKEAIKFRKYKGDTFKKIVQERQLKKYEAAFCPVCGKPLTFYFNKDDITVKSFCNCGFNKSSMDIMTYDELSLWFYSAIIPETVDRNNRFWFGEV